MAVLEVLRPHARRGAYLIRTHDRPKIDSSPYVCTPCLVLMMTACSFVIDGGNDRLFSVGFPVSQICVLLTPLRPLCARVPPPPKGPRNRRSRIIPDRQVQRVHPRGSRHRHRWRGCCWGGRGRGQRQQSLPHRF